MNTKWLKILVIVIGLVIGLIIIFSGNSSNTEYENENGNAGAKNISAKNVSIIDGKQIIEINVRGGYKPRKSIAQAGVPTVIKFITNGTFDCSAFVRVQSLNFSKMLPQSGTTELDIGIQPKGKLSGSCGMGMYSFEVEFK